MNATLVLSLGLERGSPSPFVLFLLLHIFAVVLFTCRPFKYVTTSAKFHHYLTPLQQQAVVANYLSPRVYFAKPAKMSILFNLVDIRGFCRLK